MTFGVMRNISVMTANTGVVRNIETMTADTTGETEQCRLTVNTSQRHQPDLGTFSRIATLMTLTLNVPNMIGSKHYAKSPAA